MSDQMIFRRYEMKYLLTPRQKELLLQEMCLYMMPDEHQFSTVRSLYYDTDHFLLVRRSLEKPFYKEKLRLRAYCSAGAEEPVFVELKKKYDAVVYKRRILIPLMQATDWLSGKTGQPEKSQVANEINYFYMYYRTLRPVVLLFYDREAWKASDDSGFRLTFDENIKSRTQDLQMDADLFGTSLLGEDQVLMELKVPNAVPLWLCHFLTEQRLFRTSFSKYGAAYQKLLLNGSDGPDDQSLIHYDPVL